MMRTDAGYTLSLMGMSDGFKKNTTIVTPIALYPEDLPEPTEWTPDTSYNLGQFVYSTSDFDEDNRYIFKCRKAGTSGSTEPVWNTEVDDITGDPLYAPTQASWVRTNTGGTIGEWHTIFLAGFTKSFNIHEYIYAQDQGTKDQDSSFIAVGSGQDNALVTKSGTGMALPVFGWEYELLEYAPPTSEWGGTTPLPPGHELSFGMEEVEYVDGHTEFYDGDADETNNWRNKTWSFDKKDGILYFANPIISHRYINRFKFRVRHSKVKTLSDSLWDFYKDPVTGKIDTSKIVLDPRSVRQFPLKITATNTGVSAVPLLGQNSLTTINDPSSTGMLTLDNMPGHNWSKKRIVRGSVKLASGVIGTGIEPIEVPYVDGRSELLNAINAQYKINYQLVSGVTTYETTIPGISSERPLVDDVVFEAVIIYPEPVQPSQFIKRIPIETDLSNVGDYYIDDDTGRVKVIISENGGVPLRSHLVKYSYQDNTSGLSTDNLFSIDYNNGMIYFGKTGGIAGGEISFFITMYSVFYNMGEVIQEGNIEEIDAEGKLLKIRPEYGIKFLADSTSGNPVPRYMRLQYEYNKTVTESLKDLEPYFSPVCKDIAIRAITKDMIGDI